MIDSWREVDEFVYGALNPGEQVLWTGHCLSRMGKQGKALPAAAWPAVVLAIALAASAMFAVAVITEMLFLAFVVMVATFVLTITKTDRLFEGWRKDGAMYCRQQAVYVLTNQRALVLRNCRTAHPVQSLLWAHADDVRTDRLGLDGRGTVQFLSWDPVERRWVYSLRFFMVANPQSVAEQAIAARDAARG